jgi:hypothetical protein
MPLKIVRFVLAAVAVASTTWVNDSGATAVAASPSTEAKVIADVLFGGSAALPALIVISVARLAARPHGLFDSLTPQVSRAHSSV